METRQPTRDEMVEGIARGFNRFLSEANPWGILSTERIRTAISEGAKAAMASFVAAENQGMRAALERIALNISGDTPAQVIAGEALRCKAPCADLGEMDRLLDASPIKG